MASVRYSVKVRKCASIGKCFEYLLACADVMVANFIPTRKGSLLLVYEGFAFRLKNKLAYGKKQWYCTSRTKTGCQVDVTTVIHRTGNLIKRVRNTHNHPAPGFYRRKDGSFKIV